MKNLKTKSQEELIKEIVLPSLNITKEEILTFDQIQKDNEVGKIILEQLGGSKFRFMTGVKEIRFTNSGIKMNLPVNNSKANRLYIKLNSMDTYDMIFNSEWLDKKLWETKSNTKAKFENVYCDQLRSIFEKVTGYTTVMPF